MILLTFFFQKYSSNACEPNAELFSLVLKLQCSPKVEGVGKEGGGELEMGGGLQEEKEAATSRLAADPFAQCGGSPLQDSL